MDTSKEYILMCEKAEEIQKQWKPKEWDCVYNQGDVFGYIDRSEIHVWCILPESIADSGYYGPYVYDGEICDERYKDCIWIPRQDQLYEISWTSKFDNLRFHEKMVDWFGKEHHNDMFSSMEQLWLCYVMEEKYNKHWNGNEWEVW
jgi:hypothetical protein